jgi:antitoxin (DNA-binding transcriptional repressor) of toxin-antitoxin stability system
LSKIDKLSKIQVMDTVAASHVKQNFGEVLARAAHGPVGVERHRKLVAAIVPPHWLSRHDAMDERRVARAAQQQVETMRLMAHQRLGIELLCAQPGQQRKRVEAARREVDRWEARQLCSADYIARWRAWLALSMPQLVQRMCSDADGWGSAMRQNSPFTAAGGQAGK